MTLDLKAIRRDLHQIPELAFDLPKTSQYIQDVLTSFGYTPQRIARSGWLVMIPGETDKILMFRSDMDGLPIQEQNTHDFVSRNQNMHACGHDGHMSMLLGLAHYCVNRRFKHTIALVFQPAEESEGGAAVVLQELPFDLDAVVGCFGFHLYPGCALHEVASKAHGFMATNGELDITIIGKTAHAGTPHLGQDAIVIAASCIQALQSIISRETDPLQARVLHIGKLVAGEVRNSVAHTARLEGTIRAFSQASYVNLKSSIQRMIQAFEQMHGVTIECDIRDGYPVVVNDEHLLKHVKTNVVPELVEIDPVMLAEDFGFYTQKMPSLFMFLGTGNPTSSLHSPTFDFDEDVLITGVNVYRRIIESFE